MIKITYKKRYDHRLEVFEHYFSKRKEKITKDKIISQLESLFEDALTRIEDPGDVFEDDCMCLKIAIEFIKDKYIEGGTPIEELQLQNKEYQALKRAGIDTIEQLQNYSPEKLLRVRSIGPISLARITNAFEKWMELKKSE